MLVYLKHNFNLLIFSSLFDNIKLKDVNLFYFRRLTGAKLMYITLNELESLYFNDWNEIYSKHISTKSNHFT